MGRYLTERGFANTAPLLGEVTRVDKQGQPRVLAVLQSLIHNQGDGWSWTQNMLNRAIQDAMVIEGEPQAERPGQLEEFARLAVMLGKRLGQMHAVLAQPAEDAAFAPAAASDADCARWAEDVGARLERALKLLAAQREWRDGHDQKLAARLVAQRERLLALATRWAGRGVGSLLTRIHGDLHLGQVLVAQDDIFIIDFEGEPLRPLAERRLRSSPLRDVAGMLRSFDYAAAMATGPANLGETDRARRQAILARYRQVSAQSFLAAYREAARDIPHRWAGADAEAAVLNLFTLQKAAYEIAYEASNRPAWLAVPLRGLEAVLEQAKSHG